MAIIRVIKSENPFAQIDKTPLDDPNLSFKAKGILSYVLSKPDDWKLRVSDLEKHSTDKERAIYSGLKELREVGYCKLVKVRDDQGRIIDQEYHVFEQPYRQNSNMDDSAQPYRQNSNMAKNETEPFCYFQDVENPDVDNPDVDNPDVENSDLNNNNSTNNDFTNNESEREKTRTQIFSEIPQTTKPQKPDQEKSTKKPPKPLSKKVAPKKVFPGELSFQESPFNEIENFEILLSEMGCAELDINHYYTKISLNAMEKGLTKSDWSAYIQKWIYNDKLADKLVWKKSEYSETNQQDELSRKLSRISEDLATGIFTTKKALNSILDNLRTEWKTANEFNREQINLLATAIKKELASLADIPDPKPTPKKQNQVINTKKSKLRDRLKSIKPLENTS